MNIQHTPPVIVVVEDDADTRYIFQVALEDRYTVHIVTTITPEDALAMRADLIFMDLMLAGHSGADLCRKLKAHPETKSIPVIICSALNGLPDIQDQCEADAYIAKPFDLEDLFRASEKFTSGEAFA